MFFGGFPGMGGGMGGMGGMGGPSKPVDNSKLYETLGLPKDASESEIKKAYRKLAIVHHPDKGGDVEMFKEITKAYEVLSDPEKRKTYDQYGEEGLEGGHGGGGMDASDIFSQMFGGGGGGGGQRRGPRRTQDIGTTIKCTLEQIYSGCTRKLAINREILCVGCKGEGGANGAKAEECTRCKGRGVVVSVSRMGNMITQQQGPCGDCKGEGKKIPAGKECKECNGKCISKERKVLEAVVPPGAAHGHKIVFEGESDQRPGCESGSVVVKVEVEKHAVFERKGDHLVVEKKITLLESLTGVKFMIQHLDGRKLLLKSQVGQVIAPGSIWIVSKEGLPEANNRAKKGHLVIKFDVQFPKTFDIENHGALLKEALAGTGALTKEQVASNTVTGADGKKWMWTCKGGEEDDHSVEVHYMDSADGINLDGKPQKSGQAYHDEDDDEYEDEDGHGRGGPSVGCQQA